MQDHRNPHQAFVPGNAPQLTIPAKAVDWLRSAAYAEIGLAAQALDAVAFATDREAHPEWFRAPAQSLRETYALLDAIGWSGTLPPKDVQIDLGEDGWALMRALTAALEFADDDVSERASGNAEHDGRGLASECEAEVERVGVLCDFIAAAQAHIDTLAVTEGTGDALDLAA
ncbi:MAG TPA: hypothetical protein VII53_05095 [Solirubrobacteraceae bacterium]